MCNKDVGVLRRKPVITRIDSLNGTPIKVGANAAAPHWGTYSVAANARASQDVLRGSSQLGTGHPLDEYHLRRDFLLELNTIHQHTKHYNTSKLNT